MRMLIVEDEPLIALAYGTVAAECGLDLAGTASCSASALEIARKARPELALVDLRLKDGTTGERLALALYAELAIPPLFVTGTPGLLGAAARSIAAGILVKPVPYEELARALRVAMARCPAPAFA